MPEFSPLPREHGLAELAIPLMAVSEGMEYPSGTAVFIAPGLAVGALHVVADYWVRFTGERLNCETSFQSDDAAEFAIVAHQIVEGAHVAWRASKMWAADPLDIVILELEPHKGSPSPQRWRSPAIQLDPPAVGTELLAIGYPETSVDRQLNALAWKTGLFVATGVVRATHLRRRDSVSMPFPCFQTNARFDGGMSGGPVFTTDGMLVGVVTADMPPASEGEEHASHVACIWPAMGIHICPRRYPEAGGADYPLLELARNGIIRVIDQHLVRFDSTTAQVQFNPPP